MLPAAARLIAITALAFDAGTPELQGYWEALPICRKCGGVMGPGQALAQTFHTSGEGTCSPAGPGKLVGCLKCKSCGWSVNVAAWNLEPKP